MGKVQRIKELLQDPFRDYSRLKAEEKEALKWASRGYPAWEIARVMGISEPMAAYYVRQGCLKINLPKYKIPRAVFRALEEIVNS